MNSRRVGLFVQLGSGFKPIKARHREPTRGATARREGKDRKATINQLLTNRNLVPFYLCNLIREPNKNPIEEERVSLILYPSLVQALNKLLLSREDIPINLNLEENEPEIRLVPIEEEHLIRRVDKEVETEDDEHTNLDNLDKDSSNKESLMSNDLITRNTKFIELY